MKSLLNVILSWIPLIFLNCINEFEINGDSYSLGVQDFIWTDFDREDNYYGGVRIVNARVWYPSYTSDSSLSSYYIHSDEVYSQLLMWEKLEFETIKSIKRNARIDTEIKLDTQPYPLILFSPSLGGNLSHYTWYAEQLAKNGFIVMGVNHLYESEYVLDENGLMIESNLAFHDSLKMLDIPSEITAEDYRAVKGTRQKIIGEDLIFSLDQLLNTSQFKGNIDTSRIGAFGHSIGGAGVIYASILDERIKAVIDLDGTPPTVALKEGISAPFLFIEDLTDYQGHTGYKILHERRTSFSELNKKDSWRILIGNAGHNSFLDTNYFLENDLQTRKEASHFLDQTSDYILDFFEHFLKNESLRLKAMKSDSLEIYYFKK